MATSSLSRKYTVPHLASVPGSVGLAGLPCPVEFIVQDQFPFEPCSVPMISEGFFRRLEVSLLVQVCILGAGTEIYYRVRE